MKSTNEFIYLVGGLAPPIGGVTTFLSQIAKSKHIARIIDFYPSQNKTPINLKHHISPFSSALLTYLWLWGAVSFSRGKVFHFNFSGCRALTLFLFLIKSNNKFVLQLHHGSPFQSIENSRTLLFLSKLALKRVDGIIVLGGNQLEEYKKLGADSKRNIFAKSYISGSDIFKKKEFSPLNQPKKKFIISGYPQDLYRIKETINLFKSRPSLSLKVCIYGDEKLAASFLKNIDLPSNITPYHQLTHEDFLLLMAECDCYLRPAVVDSFGIAVAEAIEIGLSVIASDACARHNGALIFESNNFEMFADAIDDFSTIGVTKLKSSTEKLFTIKEYDDFMASMLEY